MATKEPEPNLDFVHAPTSLDEVERVIARAVRRGGKHFQEPHSATNADRWTLFDIYVNGRKVAERLSPMQSCGHLAKFSLPATGAREGDKQTILCAVCDAGDRIPRLEHP